jgi:hypothetical protein
VSDDILARIDEAMARNAVRFDPLAGQQYDAFDGTSGMRWRPDGAEPLNARMAFAEPEQPVHPASPYLTREDITGRPDTVAEAFRAEVRRQGLTECVIDGVPEHVEPLRPAPFLRPSLDAALAPLVDRLEKAMARLTVHVAVPVRRRWWQWRPW